MRHMTKRNETKEPVALNGNQGNADTRQSHSTGQKQRQPESLSSPLGPHVTDDPQSDVGMQKLVRETAATRMIRRHQLRDMVPLSNTTIYEMERRGCFPKRIYITTRCVAWDLKEVEAWIESRRITSTAQAPSTVTTTTRSNPHRRKSRDEQK